MSTRVRITVDDRPHEAVVSENEDGSLDIEIEGETFHVEARTGAAGKRAVNVQTDGGVYKVERLDLRQVLVDGTPSTYRIDSVLSGKATAQVPTTGLDVRPPMPGRVVRLMVKEGDTVEEGTISGVLEAMKMQNEVTSPASGVVRRILVSEGDTVDADQVLLQLGPLEEEPSPEKKEVVA